MQTPPQPALKFAIHPAKDHATNVYVVGKKCEWIARIRRAENGLFYTHKHVGFQSIPCKFFYQFLNNLCTQYAESKGATVSKIQL
jgi:hypothetical protein